MIKTKYYILIITCLWLQAGLAATPSAFYSALKKIYPLAADVEWSQQGNYHTADFIQNGFDTKVWMNINAQWVMTNTDLQTADQLPPGAYNAFTFSSFSQWMVQNVFFIEFPKRPAVYVVQVNMDNSDAIYQLFLTPGGRMLQTKDASYNNTAISPSVFDFM